MLLSIIRKSIIHAFTAPIIGLLFLLAPTLLNGQAWNNNPYSEFDEVNHYQPRISALDWFTQSGYDLGWILLDPISTMANNDISEEEGVKKLSPGQKALYFWWYLDGQVTNGGFVQYYYNEYGKYTPAVIEGMVYIGDSEMQKIVEKAHKIYQNQKSKFEKAGNLFDSDLYDQLGGLNALDDDYYDIHEKTIEKIIAFARENPDQFCLDPAGNSYAEKKDGSHTVSNGSEKEEYTLKNGRPDGDLIVYFENGNKKLLYTFEDGQLTGDESEWYTDGTLKRRFTVNQKTKVKQKEFYHENGMIHMVGGRTPNDKKSGEFKTWYENGYLAEFKAYDNGKPIGKWEKYHENGSKELEAEFLDGSAIYHNFWNAAGIQMLTNGTGLYISTELNYKDDTIRTEIPFVDYKRHGVIKEFRNGILVQAIGMDNGLREGLKKEYYKNGNLMRETVFKKGKKISEKEFDKFTNPEVWAEIVIDTSMVWYINSDSIPPDVFPKLRNLKETKGPTGFDPALFGGPGWQQDQTPKFAFKAEINEQGSITKLDPYIYASYGLISTYDKVKSMLERLKFEPAILNGKPVASFVFIDFIFSLEEGSD